MVKFTNITYSLLRALRSEGLEIADEETQSAGEESLLLTVDGVDTKPITFNEGVERWELACTIIGRSSSKEQCYRLLDQFCEKLHGGLHVPLYTTDEVLVLRADSWLHSTGPVMTAIPFAWQFSQQFKLEILQEAT